MNKIFDKVNIKNPSKSAFDRSHERKQTQQFGKLTPCLLERVVPGDQYSCRTETLIRMQPMIAPIMERIDYYIHYFFVPSRILWDNWEEFVTGGDKGDLAPTYPVLNLASATQAGKHTLTDYFGLPTTDAQTNEENSMIVSALPFRAYHTIWNEYYRDEQLQDKVDPNDNLSPTYYGLHTRAWGKDYFTSALPNPQKGPAVNLPIDSTYSPQYKADGVIFVDGADAPLVGPGSVDYAAGILNGGGLNGTIKNLEDTQVIDSTSITIEELRRSSRLQEWLELANRGGSRLVELIQNFFGVHSGDARLQRPEYLGGGKTPITISEVLNTTGVLDDPQTLGVPQGTMSGHGIATGANNSFKYKVKEHGYIMGISSIMPQATYSQGIDRLWNESTKFDLYWPQFANIGEQEVLNDEIFHDWTTPQAPNKDAFGYQQRYAEYKYKCSSLHGDFRDNLAFWTVGRKFANQPNLNEEFIKCDDPELQDIFAVVDPEEDKFLVQMYHNLKARRPMPFFSKPEL